MTYFRTATILPALVTCLAIGAACSAPNSSSDPKGEGGTGGDGDTNTGDGDLNVGDGDIGVDNRPAPPGCGDGTLAEDEACDDGGRVDGDGCSANCLVIESGYICREEGKPCEPFAKCGDGIKSFPEQCDDGGVVAEDGCSPTCKIEIGWKCDGAPSACSATTCGDGKVEGAELCDDGNGLPFDGCSVDCQIEPTCTVGGGCTSACGDGIVLGDEGCDDGNNTDDDGCSSSCQPEDGYTCVGEPCEMVDGACVLRVPVVFRDFPVSHPDFGLYQATPEAPGGADKGMVGATLDTEGKPVPASTGSVTGLADWYRNSQGGNTGPILGSVTLFSDGQGKFINRYLEDGTRWEVPLGAPSCQPGDNGGLPCPVDGNPLFFPLDGIANAADTNTYDAEVPQPLYGGFNLANNVFPGHNFHFTTEVAYWFVFDPTANAQLTFVGDDDVWVFINGTLAVDIGNKHEPRGGRITLGATNATVGYSTDQGFQSWTETTQPISDFGLTPGGAYEIKVFHAERSTRSSSFQLTLGGFDTSKSDCAPRCGDGILGFGEECDDGVNDGGYNECQEGCVLGGYCGDGIVQEGEVCDDRDPAASSACQGCRIVVVR